MEDIFKDAKFGDRFVDIEGVVYIYHKSDIHKSSDGSRWIYHYLIREPKTYNENYFGEIVYAPYKSYVFKDGYGVDTNLKYYDVQRIKEGPNAPYLIIKKI